MYTSRKRVANAVMLGTGAALSNAERLAGVFVHASTDHPDEPLRTRAVLAEDESVDAVPGAAPGPPPQQAPEMPLQVGILAGLSAHEMANTPIRPAVASASTFAGTPVRPPLPPSHSGSTPLQQSQSTRGGAGGATPVVRPQRE